MNASLKFRIGEIKGSELKSVKSCTFANVQLLTKTSTRTLIQDKLVCRQTTFGREVIIFFWEGGETKD